MKQKQQNRSASAKNAPTGFLDLPPKDKKKVLNYAMKYAIKKQQETLRKYHEIQMKSGGLCAVYPNLSEIESVEDFYWKTYTGEWHTQMKLEDKVELLKDVLIDLLWGEL